MAGTASATTSPSVPFQIERSGQWTKGKSCDTFGPIGPWLVTRDEIRDPQSLSLWLTVNGERVQDGSTATMVFGVAALVSYLSQFMSLMPGDIISTGTPPGVGLGMKPPRYLKPGDLVELGIEGWASRGSSSRRTPDPRRSTPIIPGDSMTKITDMRVIDLRFPTSEALDGSDAMNPDPDYSAAYVILETDAAGGLEGHGLTFTIGRGQRDLLPGDRGPAPLVVGTELDTVRRHPGEYWRRLTGDSQLRWIGPDKGAMHLATGAVRQRRVDLLAKQAGKPVWRLVADLSPEDIADIVDYRYLTDV